MADQTSVVPSDMIPLIYVDRHGNLKLSQEATEIARKLRLPKQSEVDWSGKDSSPRQQIEEFTQYCKDQSGLCPQSFEQWRKAKQHDGDGDAS